VGHDAIPGVVVVPANSTEPPAALLTGPDGAGRITVTAVAAVEPAAEVSA
jgi:hypothetical protein